MMDWVYMAPDLPGDMLMGQERLGFAVGDDYRVDPDAVNALQVSSKLYFLRLKKVGTLCHNLR